MNNNSKEADMKEDSKQKKWQLYLSYL